MPMRKTTDEEWAAVEHRAAPRKPRRCVICDRIGHTKRTCPGKDVPDPTDRPDIGLWQKFKDK